MRKAIIWTSPCAIVALACLLLAGTLAAQSAPPIPQLVHTGSRYQLLVGGNPFLMLGGQAHNSSASNAQDLEPVWKSLVAMHANTAEVPVSWELIEPTEGKFDFQTVDDDVRGAREHGLRLILLWFGTWKNGASTYIPSWMKLNPTKYFKVVNSAGQPMDIISPFCAAAEAADERAFAALMNHLKSIDADHRTVIMVQVENETGLLGSDRDYSAPANKAYQSPVPQELMRYLEAHRDHLMPALESAWAGTHFRESGDWQQVFGDLAPEAFSAWYVSRYVDAVAAAGKAEYPLPMYCNDALVWPRDARAGDWPSGGPTVHVLDIWKAAAPHIDIIGPDIYIPEFLQTVAAFDRPNNPLFVPETAPSHARYVFAVLAEFNGIGFSPFGIDHSLDHGKLTSSGQEIADCYQVLRPLLPLIAKLQHTGKLFAVTQGEDFANAIHLNNRLAAVVSYRSQFRFGPPAPASAQSPSAGGIIIELAPDDYIVAGFGFQLTFRNLQGPARSPEFLSIEQGTFQGGKWVGRRRLNGDELHVNLLGGPQILRVRLYDMQ